MGSLLQMTLPVDWDVKCQATWKSFHDMLKSNFHFVCKMVKDFFSMAIFAMISLEKTNILGF